MEREGELEQLRLCIMEVEADAQRSAQDKAELRTAYESQVAGVRAQMQSLRRQLKEQVGAGVV